jgi:hypothetical protein
MTRSRVPRSPSAPARDPSRLNVPGRSADAATG